MTSWGCRPLYTVTTSERSVKSSRFLRKKEAEARAYHDKLVEAIVETDDELLGRYLEGETLPEDALRAALRQATISTTLVPVLCGAALRNKGVQLLLDAVIDYLPSPLDVPPIRGRNEDDEEVVCPVDDAAPFAAIAFKIVADPYAGKLTYLRVYSGTLRTGTYLLNATTGKRERLGRARPDARERAGKLYRRSSPETLRRRWASRAR